MDSNKYEFKGKCVTIYLDDNLFVRWYKLVTFYLFTKKPKMLLTNAFRICPDEPEAIPQFPNERF